MLYPGVKITIDGEDLVLPAISLGQLRNGTLKLLQEHDALIAEGKTFEAIALRGDVLLTAFRRNYPDYPEAKFFANVDMTNTTELWLKVLGISGFTPGERPAEGESPTGTSDLSTGA